MGHVCRKPHPPNSLGNVSVRTTCLDGSVINAFQVTGDSEEIHLVNAEVSFLSVLLSLCCWEILVCIRYAVDLKINIVRPSNDYEGLKMQLGY